MLLYSNTTSSTAGSTLVTTSNISANAITFSSALTPGNYYYSIAYSSNATGVSIGTISAIVQVASAPPPAPVISFINSTPPVNTGYLTITAATGATSYSAQLYSNFNSNTTSGILITTSNITDISTPSIFSNLTRGKYHFIQCYSSNASGLSSSFTTSAILTVPLATLPASLAASDIFLIKYTTAGALQWYTAIQGNGGCNDIGYAVAAYSTSVYVAGLYNANSAVALSNGIGTASGKSLPATTANFTYPSPFVVKYDNNGVVQWSATILSGGTNGGDAVRGVGTDSSGVYIAGYYQSGSAVALKNTDNSASGKSIPLTSGAAGFVVKYDATGVVQWATSYQYPASTSTNFSGLVLYSTDVYVSVFNGLTTGVIALKYNASGTLQWEAKCSITGSGSGYAIANAIAANSSGIYVAGIYTSLAGQTTLSNGNGTASSVSLPSTNVAGQFDTDSFMVKYDTSGAVQWRVVIQTNANDQANAVAVDSTGVYLGGLYITNTGQSATSLNNANGTASGKSLPAFLAGNSSGQSDAYLVKYDTSGVVQWATGIQGVTSDAVMAIATDSAGGVYVGGRYTSTAAVSLINGDGSSSGKTLPSTTSTSSGQDGFVVKYNTSGVVQWRFMVQGSGADVVNGIATDSTGIYATGSYIANSQLFLSDAA